MNENVRATVESATWFRLDNERRAEMAKCAAEYARMQRAERDRRAAERSEATRVPLTLEALVDVIAERVAPDRSLGPDRRREYAEHLVQGYCECELDPGWRDDAGAWGLCAHAIDEGF